MRPRPDAITTIRPPCFRINGIIAVVTRATPHTLMSINFKEHYLCWYIIASVNYPFINVDWGPFNVAKGRYAGIVDNAMECFSRQVLLNFTDQRLNVALGGNVALHYFDAIFGKFRCGCTSWIQWCRNHITSIWLEILGQQKSEARVASRDKNTFIGLTDSPLADNWANEVNHGECERMKFWEDSIPNPIGRKSQANAQNELCALATGYNFQIFKEFVTLQWLAKTPVINLPNGFIISEFTLSLCY